VATAISTSESLSQFDTGNYNAVITDMGRREDGGYNKHASLDLIRAVRARN
jgi:hypothetical protein